MYIYTYIWVKGFWVLAFCVCNIHKCTSKSSSLFYLIKALEALPATQATPTRVARCILAGAGAPSPGSEIGAGPCISCGLGFN